MIALVLACAAGAAACTGDGATTVMTSPVAGPGGTGSTGITGSTAGGAGATADGPFVLGVLLPLTGPGADLGSAVSDGVDLGVSDIDDAGGLLGFPVKVVTQDEGGDATTAARAVDSLLEEGVDAIVGPASSLTAATVLPVTTRAGVLTCSPTASAMSLDTFPSDGLFVRTIPSDSLQAAAIAEHVLETGAPSTAVLFLDDAYGRPFGDAVRAELEARSLDVKSVVSFDASDSDYGNETRVIASTGAEVVVVIGDASAGPRVVSDLFAAVDSRTQIVINDAMRVPSTASAYQRLSASELDRLRGISPTSRLVVGDFAARFAVRHPESSGVFAANGYDCTTLIGLAVRATRSADASDIAEQIDTMSHLGSECIDFETCAAELAAGLNIDYDGPSGELHIGDDGDVVRGTFELFAFDPQGRDVATDTVVIVGR